MFRRYRSRHLQSAKKLKLLLCKEGRARSLVDAAQAAREGAAPRASWAGAPSVPDAKGIGGCSRRKGRHLCAVASHIQRIAHSNCRARWNQQVPQRPPIAGWAACLSGVGVRLDQAAKLAASPHGQELKKARTVPTPNTPQENFWQGKVLGYSSSPRQELKGMHLHAKHHQTNSDNAKGVGYFCRASRHVGLRLLVSRYAKRSHFFVGFPYSGRHISRNKPTVHYTMHKNHQVQQEVPHGSMRRTVSTSSR